MLNMIAMHLSKLHLTQRDRTAWCVSVNVLTLLWCILLPKTHPTHPTHPSHPRLVAAFVCDGIHSFSRFLNMIAMHLRELHLIQRSRTVRGVRVDVRTLRWCILLYKTHPTHPSHPQLAAAFVRHSSRSFSLLLNMMPCISGICISLSKIRLWEECV